LAGLAASSIIIPNKKLRDNFNDIKRSIVYGPNLFGLVAMEAAYRYGDEWLEGLLDYLQDNLDFTLAYFEEKIPKIKIIKPQGTYLIWLDCRSLGLENIALRDFMRNEAKVGLDDGFLFGVGGSGFQRMNIACPRSILEEALSRIKTAVNSL
jgi:cystathionine beta-lyase